GMDLPLRAVREQMCAAINLVVHQARLRDGSRRITQITEVQGMEGDTPVTQDIFVFRQTGMTPEGRVAGDVVPTGIRPKVMEEIDKAGIQLPASFFDAPGDGPGGHSW
ncbi:MAG TPA: CpaF family protein, partial [Armatimonadota bacterium]